MLAVSGALSGCSGPAEEKPPNIVVITLDTTRRDHLSTYGYHRETSPFLTQIAEQGLRFDEAVSPATWTLPAHVSMFTGLDPHEHGVWPMLGDAEGMRGVADDTRILGEMLEERGYRCVAAVGGPFPTTRYGVLRGFHERREPSTEEGQVAGSVLNDWLSGKLSKQRAVEEPPLFLFVNYFDAHAPYDAAQDVDYPFALEGAQPERVENLEGRVFASPEEEARVLGMAVDQYDRELYIQDLALAELWGMLEAGGYLEDALVVITSDHGEMFGEQPATYGHGCAPFEPVAGVPLVVYRSGGEPGVRSESVSTSNVARTVLQAIGADLELPGADLCGDLEGLAPAYSEQHSPEQWVGVVYTERGKFAAPLDSLAGTPQAAQQGYFIDLVENPGEALERAVLDPSHAEYGTGAATLKRTLSGWRQPPQRFTAVELSDGELRLLEGLGYTGD